MHTRSRVLLHVEQAFEEDPRVALIALRQLLEEDIPWIERTVIRTARSQGYDWARIGRLLRRTRQAVRKRNGAIDGTFEPIMLDAPDPGVKLMADYERWRAERRRHEEFEEWAASGDVVAW
jgi:hypothetical protein